MHNNKMLMAFAGFCFFCKYFHRLGRTFAQTEVLAPKNIIVIHKNTDKTRKNQHGVKINLETTETTTYEKAINSLIKSNKEKWDNFREQMLKSGKLDTQELISYIEKENKENDEDLFAICNVCDKEFSDSNNILFYEKHPAEFTCLDCFNRYKEDNATKKELPCLICGIEIKQIPNEKNNIFCRPGK